MKNFIRRCLLASCLLSQAAIAHASASCAEIVTNAQEAADRADLVLEATVTLFSYSMDKSRSMSVVVEQPRALRDLEASSLYATMRFPVDACFSNRAHMLNNEAVDRATGKRMRFYLTKLTRSRGYRLFFMQPLSEAAPTFTKTQPMYATAAHAPSHVKPLPDGWQRARSTDGKFSIDMPGAFEDITKGGPDQPAFMLRSRNRDGTIFMAVFERSGPDVNMAGTFDNMAEKSDATFSTFKGAMAISTKGTVPSAAGELTAYGMWFRIPGGTFMLSVAASKQHEATAFRDKERFFNSLDFK